ncbi:MAG: four helix bundle protein [Proteobacteria bacterium]|nr:four helix bundle protein [Pseudomonadota bacterium]
MEKSKGIRFRFENLDIWQRACQIATKLFSIADMLEEKKLYRFADQLRGAGLSMPNNIAEGSGSTSKKEFIQFLNIARRSTFENASMVMMFTKDKLINEDIKDEVVKDLDELCRMITSFSRSLNVSKELRAKSFNSTERRAGS